VTPINRSLHQLEELLSLRDADPARRGDGAGGE